MDDCAWTTETKVDNYLITFDPSDNINKYIFTLKTVGRESGYIAIDISLEYPFVSDFSFGGRPVLLHMLEHDGYEINNFFGRSSQRIYCLGTYDYAIKSKGVLMPLAKGDNDEDLTFEEASTVYSDMLKIKKNNMKIQKNNQSLGSKNLLETQQKSENSNEFTARISVGFTISVMDDFAGYKSHCGPTAGTNLIKNWAYQRGITKLQQNSIDIFKSLYSYMNTTSNGTMYTPVNNAYTGLQSHANSRGVSATYKSQDTTPTYNEIIAQLDNNRPVMIAAASYKGSSGHFVCAFAYKSGNYLGSLNGWDRYVDYTLYSNIDAKRSFYIAY